MDSYTEEDFWIGLEQYCDGIDFIHLIESELNIFRKDFGDVGDFEIVVCDTLSLLWESYSEKDKLTWYLLVWEKLDKEKLN